VIKKLHQLFTAHPHKVGESYFQHCLTAMRFSFQTLYIAIVLFIHALFPFLFETKGSNKILQLANTMKSRQDNCDYRI